MNYTINAFEGSKGSFHRLRPVFNCQVHGESYRTTTYGWEGQEIAKPKDKNLPIVFWDVLDGSRQLQSIVVVTPEGVVWKRNNNDYVEWWSCNEETHELPVKREIVELVKKHRNCEVKEPQKRKRGRPCETGTGKSIYIPAYLVKKVEKLVEDYKQKNEKNEPANE